ncbi:hypothetical protein [Geopseudomonas aromaticivorans]
MASKLAQHLDIALNLLAGAALGSLLLGLVPTRLLVGVLGVILLGAAVKTFRHAH